jgi:hypothetical protein
MEIQGNLHCYRKKRGGDAGIVKYGSRGTGMIIAMIFAVNIKLQVK